MASVVSMKRSTQLTRHASVRESSFELGFSIHLSQHTSVKLCTCKYTQSQHQFKQLNITGCTDPHIRINTTPSGIRSILTNIHLTREHRAITTMLLQSVCKVSTRLQYRISVRCRTIIRAFISVSVSLIGDSAVQAYSCWSTYLSLKLCFLLLHSNQTLKFRRVRIFRRTARRHIETTEIRHWQYCAIFQSAQKGKAGREQRATWKYFRSRVDMTSHPRYRPSKRLIQLRKFPKKNLKTNCTILSHFPFFFFFYSTKLYWPSSFL